MQVCYKHFTEEDIRRTSEMYDPKTGRKIVADLEIPRLRDGVIPSVFPNCPSYLSSSTNSRESVEQKRREIRKPKSGNSDQ